MIFRALEKIVEKPNDNIPSNCPALISSKEIILNWAINIEVDSLTPAV